ncbi:WAT1-related protein At1g43650-like [Dioscorea cayenensis subsp. rotundata]|uniref:WAT1-related protein n=1 Tax=Dioscorea cayennensis subsp. rotundata TaxID=55577 RepID=A0AB40BGM2_DIOCR|nr:WAT1-related protein At1g43650-like [Dioscorea cayenensis subsp. rotundata]
MDSQRTCMPYLAMVLTQLIFAGMALFTKAAVGGGMNPYIFVFYREVFATLFLAPFILFFERNKGLPRLPMMRIFFTAFCGDTLSSFLYTISLRYTSATFASASTNAIPSITLVLALLSRVEKLSKKKKLYGAAKLAGSSVSLAGAFIFSLYKGPAVKFINEHQLAQEASSSLQNSISKANWVKGCLIMLVAHTCWSTWLILQGPLVKSYPAELRLTFVQCLCSAMQTAVIAVIFERSPSSWKLKLNIPLLAAVYCGLATGISFWLITWCVDKKGPVFTSAFTPMALLATAIFSAIVWKETLHWGSVIGAVLLVVGLYCVLWGKSKEEKPLLEEQEKDEGIGHNEKDPESNGHS